MAKVPQMIEEPFVILLALLAEVSGVLRRLAETLREYPDVSSVERRCDLEDGGPDKAASIEWYVDAELVNGNAFSWRLLLYWTAGEWVIESDLSRTHAYGSDSVVELATRYAEDSDDMQTELRSAVKDLVATVKDASLT
jgi:hypothetical protein